MSLKEKIYEYISTRYKENEPILLSQLEIPGIKAPALRQQLKKLLEEGKIKRFDTGVYFIPKKSMFKSGSSISVEDVIQKKYLQSEDGKCGYISGMLLANRIGLTTQVPSIYEVTTNKATTDYREVKIANIRVIIRRPYVAIDNGNINNLQFLDLLKEVTDISEIDGEELNKILIDYMKQKGINFDDLKPFLSFYPDRIYRNMYEVGLLNGISA